MSLVVKRVNRSIKRHAAPVWATHKLIMRLIQREPVGYHRIFWEGPRGMEPS